MQYDVIHVEDSRAFGMGLRMSAEGEDLSYKIVTNLKSLKEILLKNNARIYVVDGNFPREGDNSELAEMLMPEAIKLIKARSENPTIIVYSSDNKLAEIAEQNGAEYRLKSPKFDTIALMKELKSRLH